MSTDFYEDMPNLVSTSEVPVKIMGHEPCSTNNVLCTELVHLLIDNTTPEEVKQRVCGYMYPSVFRTHNDNVDFVEFFLVQGYVTIARIMGYEHKCWNRELFERAFSKFMSSTIPAMRANEFLKCMQENNMYIPH